MSDIESAKAQVIEELEQVIEKDRQRSPRMADEENEEEPSVMLTEDKEDSVQRPMRTGEGFVDEEGIRNRNTSGCSGFAGCCKVTYDVMRSVPFFTFVWAGGAIYASNMAVRNVEQIASTMQVFSYFTQLFRIMDWGLAYIDFVNSFIAVLAILFSGATLELFVGRFCKFDGCYRYFSRFSFRALQGLFFPLAYLGFLEALALLVMSVVLAFAVVLTNMTCDFATSETMTAKAATYLSEQINLVTHWLAIKAVTIDANDLANYCTTNSASTTWFWRKTFIYVTAATIFQVNLAVTMWTVYLNTGYEIRKHDIVRKHSSTIEKYREQEKRPVSMRSDVSLRSDSRPFSGRYEAKEDLEA